MRERIGEKSVVADDESFQSENDLRKRGENQQREQNAKAQGVNQPAARFSLGSVMNFAAPVYS